VRFWHILRSRLRSLFHRDRVESDLSEELQHHLDRETEQLEASGLSYDAARRRARLAFGGVESIKDACRDQRGTALVDNLVRDVLYACRSFHRAPLAALTIVTTVALGLGLVAAVFTFVNEMVFRVDEVRNPHELFAVEHRQSPGAEPERFTRPQYEALRRETGVFSDAFAIADVNSRIDGRKMQGSLVTGNFFEVVDVTAARGRMLTPSDDEGGGRQAIVLSHRGWARHFATDPAAIDRTVLVNDVPFQVVGVMPEGFRGLTVAAPDFWAPLSAVGQFRPIHAGREDPVDVGIVGRLKPGVSRERALAELLVWDARRAAEGSVERRVSDLVLEPKQGTVPLSAETMTLYMPLFFAFGLILLIGCANVANLLLARGVARQREIGIRLAIGASRRRIVWQLLTESLLLALVSAALAFGISRLVLEAVVYGVMSTMPPDFGDVRLAAPPADLRVALFLVAGAMASTVLFALAPALQATRFELVRAVRGEVVRDGRPGRARNLLIAVQVTASVLLLICSAMFLRSSLAAATVDPGLRADTIVVGISNEQMRGPTLEAVSRDPSIASVAASWPDALGRPRAAVAEAAAAARAAADQTADERGKSRIGYRFVSPEYFGVLGIDVVRGRGFVQTERSASAAVAVVSGKRRASAVAESRPARADPAARAGHEWRRRAARRTASARPRLCRRGDRQGRRALPARRRQGDGCLRANQRRGGQDLARVARARQSGACQARARRAAHGDRSQHGRGPHARDHRGNGGVLSEDRVLAHAGAWRAGAAADAVRSLQRALVSRRATHQGARGADGAWRDPPKHRHARAVTVGSSRRPGVASRRQSHDSTRGSAPGDTGGRRDQLDGSSVRSGRIRRQPSLHRRGVRLCGADSRASGGTDRSSRRSPAGVIRRPAAVHELSSSRSPSS
jgi:predicted permease